MQVQLFLMIKSVFDFQEKIVPAVLAFPAVLKPCPENLFLKNCGMIQLF
jgi:hypothetical protein